MQQEEPNKMKPNQKDELEKKTDNEFVRKFAEEKYKYGFTNNKSKILFFILFTFMFIPFLLYTNEKEIILKCLLPEKAYSICSL